MTTPYIYATRDRLVKLYEAAVEHNSRGAFDIQCWVNPCGTAGCFAFVASRLWPEALQVSNPELWPETPTGAMGHRAIAQALGISREDSYSFCNSCQTNAEALANLRGFVNRHWPGTLPEPDEARGEEH